MSLKDVFCGIQFWAELFSQWSSRFTLTPHGKSMMHRCSLIESMSYLGGAMHQCPNCRHYLSWWEKNSSHSTGASGHSNETSRGSFAEDGWRPRARWTWEMIQQQNLQKKDTRMMKIILSVSSTLFETGWEWIGCALLRECILGMANFMFEFLESSLQAIWNLAIDHDTGCCTFVRTRSSSALMSKSHGNKHM